MTLFKNKYRIETMRLQTRNYASAGWYFLTICMRDRKHFFGEVIEGQMRLSEIGPAARQFWQDIPLHSPTNLCLDTFVVMPSHVHGIIVIDEAPVETLPATSLLFRTGAGRG